MLVASAAISSAECPSVSLSPSSSALHPLWQIPSAQWISLEMDLAHAGLPINLTLVLVEAEDEVSAAKGHTDLVWLTVNDDSLSSQPLKPADIVSFFSLMSENPFDSCVLQTLGVKHPVSCSLGVCHSLISF